METEFIYECDADSSLRKESCGLCPNGNDDLCAYVNWDNRVKHIEPLFEPVIKTDQEHILYRVFDDKFRLLYAGVTLNMYQRFNGHKHTAEWWTHAKHIMIERFESRAELMAAERRVIVTERPKYNKQHNGGS